jgi:hypothetical protein
MVFFSEAQLRYAIKEYVAHYHFERNHQGVGNKLLKGPKTLSDHRESKDEVVCHERLGGLLKDYSRKAA